MLILNMALNFMFVCDPKKLQVWQSKVSTYSYFHPLEAFWMPHLYKCYSKLFLRYTMYLSISILSPIEECHAFELDNCCNLLSRPRWWELQCTKKKSFQIFDSYDLIPTITNLPLPCIHVLLQYFNNVFKVKCSQRIDTIIDIMLWWHCSIMMIAKHHINDWSTFHWHLVLNTLLKCWKSRWYMKWASLQWNSKQILVLN
jgi:hypothetical protein